MPLEAGTKLGPYEVTGPIGAGGMGEVYRARDTKLNRDVALKVLPEAFVNEPERLARFQREAVVLASLNHPNIAHIYGLESHQPERSPARSDVAEREVLPPSAASQPSGGLARPEDGRSAKQVGPRDTDERQRPFPYLVLELVEGPTLADRIREGAIPLDEALDIASQITEALEAAHAHGIIHRDLKPANIKITHDGLVKVLDFGLAKAFVTGDGPDAESSMSPTLTKGTALGVILGTAAYMSPEQAKGKPVDTRTDVWAFGAVLYEMLAGERAFKGDDVSDTLVSVFRDEPDWAKLPSGTPARIIQALRVCLTKSTKGRVRDISAVRLAMAGAFETTSASSSTAPVARSRSIFSWLVATAALTAMVVGLAVWNFKPREPRPVVRFAHVLPDEQTLTSNYSGRPTFAIAPDGNRLVYSANGQLYLRNMNEAASQPIPATDSAMHPFFSHDGEWIGFWARGELKKVPVGGGAPVRLTADVTLPVGIDWSEDDWIVYADEARGIWRLPGSGGTPENVIPNQGLYAPQMLTDENVLVTAIDANESRIAVYALVTGERKDVFPGGRPYYVRTGHLVFEQGGSIFGVGFDRDTLEVKGAPLALVDGIDTSGAPQFEVSESGALAYISADDGSGRERVLGVASRDGDVEFLDVPPSEYVSPRVSPDGARLVVQTFDADGADAGTLWVYALSGERAMRQLTLEGNNQRPLWTPDGRRITFASDREGTMSLYWQPADGSGVAERLTTAEEGTAHYPSSWSPDGKTLVYMVHNGTNLQTDWDVWTLSLEDGTAESLYDLADGVHIAPELSPDGRWLAYTSGPVAGSQDVYVEPFPPTGARQRISQNGAYWPTWSPGGDALIYRPVSGARERVLNRVDITTAPEFGFTNERPLPVDDFIVVGFHRDYDFTPDGESLLMVFPAARAEGTTRPRQRIHIVLNWDEELKARVPVE